ncbi:MULTISPECIES: trimeric intracellular cation channel family protein [Chromohalobacter]|uniref:trimeric intracellular cation channel family protein n=1 Tax=Chromohalobacter TaxID=42054 RepID=UPI0001065AA8|nr:trimeric intracellular cation channel family protein [Chromohalobacter salexigens]MDO0945179.1 trimeric intracellular cation channel family protein [Chromohalobacter salexigens]PWW42704.1 putative membrane protein YeiH [Chromohalobacter salexigens]
MAEWIYWLDLAGVIVFALSGVIIACRSRMDPFGMLVLAAMTGIGGGTLRDLLLGIRPVFWVTDPTYLWVIIITVVSSIVGFHYIHRLSRIVLPVLDAFGLAIFTIIGAHKALALGHGGTVAVLMGLLTGVAGGMLRDVLARRVPMVLRQEIYATASIAGATAYVTLYTHPIHPYATIALPILVILALRLSAIYWRLSLPVFAWITSPAEPSSRSTMNNAAPSPSEIEKTPRSKARVRMLSPKRRRR